MTKLTYSFMEEDAQEFGLNAAVILNNIRFWLKTNEAKKTNQYDGFTWTYNSKDEFALLFPFLTVDQVKYALSKMVDAGILMVGNYNKSKYDRTLWYTIPSEFPAIVENPPMESEESPTQLGGIPPPIPDINTDRIHLAKDKLSRGGIKGAKLTPLNARKFFPEAFDGLKPKKRKRFGEVYEEPSIDLDSNEELPTQGDLVQEKIARKRGLLKAYYRVKKNLTHEDPIDINSPEFKHDYYIFSSDLEYLTSFSDGEVVKAMKYCRDKFPDWSLSAVKKHIFHANE